MFSSQDPTAQESLKLLIPFLQTTNGPIQLSIARPKFHGMVFFVGLVNLARTIVAHYPDPGGTAAGLTYGAAPALSMIIAWLVRKAKKDETSRVASSALGLLGFVLTSITTEHPDAVPLGLVAGMVTLHIAICALTRKPKSKTTQPETPAREV